MKDSLSGRVMLNVAAHIYAQGVTILTQFLSLPIFLHYWDINLYGKWLLLCAVPTYLGMADIGIMAATANQVTMLVAKGDNQRANRVFQSALAAALAVISFLAVTAIILIYIFGIPAETSLSYRTALICLTFASLISIIGGLLDAVYRSAGKYSKVTFYLTTTRAIEWLGSVLGVVLFQGIEHAAIGFLLGRLASTIVLQQLAASEVKHVQWRLRDANLSDIRSMLKPGVTLFLFTFGTTVNIQGIVLLIGHILGPGSVALFNSYRVLSRTLTQIPTLIGQSLMPEISRLFALGHHGKIRSIYVKSTALCVTLVSVGALFLYQFGEDILRIWSHGKVSFQQELFGILLISTSLTSFYQMGKVLLTSTNRHESFAVAYLLITGIFFGVSVQRIHERGLIGVAQSLTLLEFVMIAATLIYVFRSNRSISERGANI